MLTMRLHDVRRALSEADCEAPTVTRIAMQHGFRELGRFAVTYRRVFGEAPSQTLRAKNLRAGGSRPTFGGI
jgi:transcriptional regulator GlxA family with amidase domain